MLGLSLKRATESEEEMVANVPVSQKSHKAALGIRQVSLVFVQTPKVCASVLQTEVCAGPLRWLRHRRRSSRGVTGASGARVLSAPQGDWAAWALCSSWTAGACSTSLACRLQYYSGQNLTTLACGILSF